MRVFKEILSLQINVEEDVYNWFGLLAKRRIPSDERLVKKVIHIGFDLQDKVSLEPECSTLET